jgi:MFS family permease
MESHELQDATTPLWRNRNYLLLQGGQLISFIGDQQQFIALPLLILALTGSAVQAGLAVGLSTVAVLMVSPLAGALVDRWDRKRTMLICDAGRLLLTLTIPLAFWFHLLNMPLLYGIVALSGVLGTFFNVAQTAALPNVVARAQLPAALAQTQAAYACVRTSGSLIGGALYSLGAALPFLANAISFAASTLSLGLIRGKLQSLKSQEEGPRQALSQSIAEGFTWLWRQPLLRFLTIINGADSLRYGAGYLVIIMLARELHTSASGIGAIFTGAAIGALAGNLASSWARRRFSFGKIAISMLWLEALMFPLYAIAPNALIMGIIAAAEELVSPIYTIALNTYRLVATPDTLRGRVSSTVQLIVQGTQALGALVSGLLIQSIGARGSALLLGAWLILLASATTLNRRVRHADQPGDATAEPLPITE